MLFKGRTLNIPTVLPERERKREREREGERALISTEEDYALDNGYYASQECHAILQPLYMDHFLTALATSQTTDTQWSHSLVITRTHILLSQW